MLQSQMKQVELDTIDVITFLKAQDQKKDTIVRVKFLSVFMFFFSFSEQNNYILLILSCVKIIENLFVLGKQTGR